mmetsp:Transcript_20802/g.30865  ORF Transcript_20802/g.30865 Transcript_20802/m.30865 type:complete len:159 (-) Transcript_20802:27-503(-)
MLAHLGDLTWLRGGAMMSDGDVDETMQQPYTPSFPPRAQQQQSKTIRTRKAYASATFATSSPREFADVLLLTGRGSFVSLLGQTSKSLWIETLDTFGTGTCSVVPLSPFLICLSCLSCLSWRCILYPLHFSLSLSLSLDDIVAPAVPDRITNTTVSMI